MVPAYILGGETSIAGLPVVVDAPKSQHSDVRNGCPLTFPNNMSVASLSQTAFHEKCQEAGGACAVEMDQENAIALLLKQQQEVLRELRDQKKVCIARHAIFLLYVVRVT